MSDYPFQIVMNSVMDNFSNYLSCDDYIAFTRSFLENIFLCFICIVTKTPLIISGPPGCSKTLATKVIADNMKGSESTNEFFRKYPSIKEFTHQCHAETTANELKITFDRACTHQKKIDSTSVKETSVVLLDESGLLKEKRNALKIIHYYLDHPQISSILLTNDILDAAKTNRCCLLVQTEPDLDELICLCKSVFGIGKNCDALTKAFVHGLCKAFICVNKRKFEEVNVIFFHLRDFNFFIRFLRRLCSGSQGNIPLEAFSATDITFVLHQMDHSLQRNFNGLSRKTMKEIILIFRKSVEEECLKVNIKVPLPGEIVLENTLDLARESLLDHQPLEEDPNSASFRFLMLIDEDEARSGVELLSDVNIINESFERVELSDYESDDSTYERTKAISSVKKYIKEKGINVLLLNCHKISTNFYDLFNRYFKRYKSEPNVFFAQISDGTYSALSPVDPHCKIILHVTLEDIKKGLVPLPLLSRFEKYFVCFDDVIQYQIQKKAHEIRVNPKVIQNSFELIKKGVEDFVDTIKPEALYGFVEGVTIESLMVKSLIESRENQFLIPRSFHPGIDDQELEELEYFKEIARNPELNLSRIIRQFNFFLMQIAKTHSFYLSRSVFQKCYLEEYLIKQHHLTAENFIQHLIRFYLSRTHNQMPEKREEARDCSKWMIYTRTSAEATLFSMKGSGYVEALEKSCGCSFVIHDLSQFSTYMKSVKAVEKYMKKFDRATRKKVLFFVANMRIVKRSQINSLRNILETELAKKWKENIYPLVILVIHFPQSHANLKSSYHTVFLNHWHFNYCDVFSTSIGENRIGDFGNENETALEKVKNKIDPRYWFRVASGYSSEEVTKNQIVKDFSDALPSIIEQFCGKISIPNLDGNLLGTQSKRMWNCSRVSRIISPNQESLNLFLNEFLEKNPILEEKILGKFACIWKNLVPDLLMNLCVEIQRGHFSRGIANILFEKLKFHLLGIVQFFLTFFLEDYRFESVLLLQKESEKELLDIWLSDMMLPNIEELEANVKESLCFIGINFLPFKIPFFLNVKEFLIKEIQRSEGNEMIDLVDRLENVSSQNQALCRVIASINHDHHLKECYFFDLLSFSLDLSIVPTCTEEKERKRKFDLLVPQICSVFQHLMKLFWRNCSNDRLMKDDFSIFEMHIFFFIQSNLLDSVCSLMLLTLDSEVDLRESIETCQELEDIHQFLIEKGIEKFFSGRSLENFFEESSVEHDDAVKRLNHLVFQIKEMRNIRLGEIIEKIDYLCFLEYMNEYVVKDGDNFEKMNPFSEVVDFQSLLDCFQRNFDPELFEKHKDNLWMLYLDNTSFCLNEREARLKAFFENFENIKKEVFCIRFRRMIEKDNPLFMLDFFEIFDFEGKLFEDNEFFFLNKESMNPLKEQLFKCFSFVAHSNLIERIEDGFTMGNFIQEFEEFQQIFQNKSKTDRTFLDIMKRNCLEFLLVEYVVLTLTNGEESLEDLKKNHEFERLLKFLKDSGESKNEGEKTMLVKRVFTRMGDKKRLSEFLRDPWILEKIGGLEFQLAEGELDLDFSSSSLFPFQIDRNSDYSKFANHVKEKEDAGEEIIAYLNQKVRNEKSIREYRMYVFLIILCDYFLKGKACFVFFQLLRKSNVQRMLDINEKEMGIYLFFCKGPDENPPFTGDNLYSIFAKENVENQTQTERAVVHLLGNMLAILLGSPRESLHFYTRMFHLRELIGSWGPGSHPYNTNFDCGYQVHGRMRLSIDVFGKNECYHSLNNFFTWAALGMSLLFFDKATTEQNLDILLNKGDFFDDLDSIDAWGDFVIEEKVIRYIMNRTFTFWTIYLRSPTIVQKSYDPIFFANHVLYLVWRSVHSHKIFQDDKFVNDTGKSYEDAKRVLWTQQEKTDYEKFWMKVGMRTIDQNYSVLSKPYEEYSKFSEGKKELFEMKETNDWGVFNFDLFEEFCSLELLENEETGEWVDLFQHVLTFLESERLSLELIPELLEFEGFLYNTLRGKFTKEEANSISIKEALFRVAGSNEKVRSEFLEKFRIFKESYNAAGNAISMEGFCPASNRGAHAAVFAFQPIDDEFFLGHIISDQKMSVTNDYAQNRLRFLIKNAIKKQNDILEKFQVIDPNAQISNFDIRKIIHLSRKNISFIGGDNAFLSLQKFKDFAMCTMKKKEEGEGEGEGEQEDEEQHRQENGKISFNVELVHDFVRNELVKNKPFLKFDYDDFLFELKREKPNQTQNLEISLFEDNDQLNFFLMMKRLPSSTRCEFFDPFERIDDTNASMNFLLAAGNRMIQNDITEKEADQGTIRSYHPKRRRYCEFVERIMEEKPKYMFAICEQTLRQSFFQQYSNEYPPNFYKTMPEETRKSIENHLRILKKEQVDERALMDYREAIQRLSELLINKDLIDSNRGYADAPIRDCIKEQLKQWDNAKCYEILPSGVLWEHLVDLMKLYRYYLGVSSLRIQIPTKEKRKYVEKVDIRFGREEIEEEDYDWSGENAMDDHTYINPYLNFDDEPSPTLIPKMEEEEEEEGEEEEENVERKKFEVTSIKMFDIDLDEIQKAIALKKAEESIEEEKRKREEEVKKKKREEQKRRELEEQRMNEEKRKREEEENKIKEEELEEMKKKKEEERKKKDFKNFETEKMIEVLKQFFTLDEKKWNVFIKHEIDGGSFCDEDDFEDIVLASFEEESKECSLTEEEKGLLSLFKDYVLSLVDEAAEKDDDIVFVRPMCCLSFGDLNRFELLFKLKKEIPSLTFEELQILQENEFNGESFMTSTDEEFQEDVIELLEWENEEHNQLLREFQHKLAKQLKNEQELKKTIDWIREYYDINTKEEDNEILIQYFKEHQIYSKESLKEKWKLFESLLEDKNKKEEAHSLMGPLNGRLCMILWSLSTKEEELEKEERRTTEDLMQIVKNKQKVKFKKEEDRELALKVIQEGKFCVKSFMMMMKLERKNRTRFLIGRFENVLKRGKIGIFNRTIFPQIEKEIKEEEK